MSEQAEPIPQLTRGGWRCKKTLRQAALESELYDDERESVIISRRMLLTVLENNHSLQAEIMALKYEIRVLCRKACPLGKR